MVILIAGFFLWPTNFFKPIKNGFYFVERPFSVVGNVVANRVTLFFNHLFHLASLGKENELLIKENLDLQSKLSMLNEVTHENEILKEELGLLNKTTPAFQLTPATIIGRSSSGYLKTIVIDRGSKDGVKVGQAIITQGYLVGTVKTVFEGSSEVDLITDYNSLVPVLLQDSRGTGLLRGGIKGLVVEEIPLNVSVKKDEQLITSGLGGDIPPGILVGKVEGVVSQEGEVFQKATIQSPVQMYFLEFVFIVNV